MIINYKNKVLIEDNFLDKFGFSEKQKLSIKKLSKDRKMTIKEYFKHLIIKKLES